MVVCALRLCFIEECCFCMNCRSKQCAILPTNLKAIMEVPYCKTGSHNPLSEFFNRMRNGISL